jgi:hypothetical protein
MGLVSSLCCIPHSDIRLTTSKLHDDTMKCAKPFYHIDPLPLIGCLC